MKRIYSIASVLFLVMAVSCGSKDEEVKTETPATTPANTPVNTVTSDIPVNSTTVPTVPTVPSTNTTPTNTVTTTNGTPVNITPTITQQSPVATTAKGMNPAHGQPGHRCDIAVGAPLNSAPNPSAATTPTINTNPAPATMSPSIVNTSPKINTTPPAQPVAAGMNPAHGQPGHRCDISVGAPLNSPVTPNYTPPATKQEVPVKKDN